MTEVSVSFKDSTLATLRDYSAHQSQNLSQCISDIVEKHLSEQEYFDKIVKVKNNLLNLIDNTTADVGSAVLSREATYERDSLKKKEELTAYFIKLREKTHFSLGKVTWNEEDLYD